MNIQQYLVEMKEIQENLLNYIEDESINDKKLQYLNIFEKYQIHEDRHKLMSFFYLLVNIANNHHRDPNFYEKIDTILKIFQNDIKKYFSNVEIFNIFKGNNRILLFLFEQKIMIFDVYIAKKIIFSQNYEYFLPELRNFIKEIHFSRKKQEIYNKIINTQLPENFHQNRKVGENESLISKFIREDSIIGFIVYVNKNHFSLKSEIKQSIFETNPFLIEKYYEYNLPPLFKNNHQGMTLLKYAVFFGSIQIIRYLLHNGCELTPELWPFAIHGQNADVIHLLEENRVDLPFINKKNEIDLYEECFIESIKCHHNSIAQYIQTNYLKKENSNKKFAESIKNYNFLLIQSDLIDESSFSKICKYGYYYIAHALLKDGNIDINKI